ncbi:hypothetical protein CVU37_12565 [candidate division BRC1 bacterium HGW-BRC1-1]|jgi:predicted ABC-type ATPase|nr:MAG: hypothetical protein CVU37_12565 [candidate division BRC1 bacterium HGW-BRC1-1]
MWIDGLVPSDAMVLDERRMEAELPREGYSSRWVAARRLYFAAMREGISTRETIALESRATGRGLVRWARRLKDKGYCVQVVVLSLASADLAHQRVLLRRPHRPVESSFEFTRGCFERGRDAVETFPRGLADSFVVIDNSDREPRMVEECVSDGAGPGILPAGFLLQNLRMAVHEQEQLRAARGWPMVRWRDGRVMEEK